MLRSEQEARAYYEHLKQSAGNKKTKQTNKYK